LLDELTQAVLQDIQAADRKTNTDRISLEQVNYQTITSSNSLSEKITFKYL